MQLSYSLEVELQGFRFSVLGLLAVSVEGWLSVFQHSSTERDSSGSGVGS